MIIHSCSHKCASSPHACTRGHGKRACRPLSHLRSLHVPHALRARLTPSTRIPTDAHAACTSVHVHRSQTPHCAACLRSFVGIQILIQYLGKLQQSKLQHIRGVDHTRQLKTRQSTCATRLAAARAASPRTPGAGCTSTLRFAAWQKTSGALVGTQEAPSAQVPGRTRRARLQRRAWEPLQRHPSQLANASRRRDDKNSPC